MDAKSNVDEVLATWVAETSCLLFSVLVLAELEHLAASFHSAGLNDLLFSDIDLSKVSMSTQERQAFCDQCKIVSPILQKGCHAKLRDAILPFKSFIPQDHGNFQVFQAKIAEGHLQGCNNVSNTHQSFLSIVSLQKLS